MDRISEFPSSPTSSLELLIGRVEGKLTAVDTVATKLVKDVSELQISFVKLEGSLKLHGAGCPLNAAAIEEMIDDALLRREPVEKKKEQEEEDRKKNEADRKKNGLQTSLNIVSLIISIIVGLFVIYQSTKDHTLPKQEKAQQEITVK